MRHFSGRYDGPSRQRPLRTEEESLSDNESSSNDVTQNADGAKKDEEEEEEDDYMNMTFDDVAPAQPETSLQRRQRLRKEGLKRGQVPSKAELAAQERERREEGLSRSLISSDRGAAAAGGASAAAAAVSKSKSKGLAMMAKMGFTPGSTLGRGGADGAGARSEPIRIEIKEDRGGIGADADKKRKLQEAAEAAGLAKRARVEEVGDYRERMAREREAARREKQVSAAQRIAEGMDEEKGGVLQDVEADGGEEKEKEKERREGVGKSGMAPSRPLKSVPVLYRGLVRQREEKERDRRMRYDLEQSSGGLSAKLPAYDDDDDLDGDDRLALGRTEKKTIYMPADDLDEEDSELDEFNGLEPGEKLLRIVKYLREKYRYCFWCKCAYPDEEMDGCPGLTEEDHD